MSGLFGRLAGEMLEGGGAGVSRPAVTGVLQEALTQFGGVPGLVSMFEQAGLGEHVRSWVGNGQNLPVSPDQLQQVFSSPTVEGWAQRLGVPPQTMLGLLSQVLPQAVDHVTPGGTADVQPGPSGWTAPDNGGQASMGTGGAGGQGGPAAGGFNLGGLVGKLFGEE